MKITFVQYFLAFCISILFAGCEKKEQPITGGGSTTTSKYTISGRSLPWFVSSQIGMAA